MLPVLTAPIALYYIVGRGRGSEGCWERSIGGRQTNDSKKSSKSGDADTVAFCADRFSDLFVTARDYEPQTRGPKTDGGIGIAVDTSLGSSHAGEPSHHGVVTQQPTSTVPPQETSTAAPPGDSGGS